ncbi:MAG: hypothetical protein MUC48_21695 [Leptolyngbya sp. Prado105]|jgi:hypothetical protein|nr:hypothetical protein [Leptolyngbya sp. Prado105]
MMINNLKPTETEAGELAIAFLAEDLGITRDDQEWLTVMSAKFLGESWYVVEIGIEGTPDKWVVQVYDTRECDPSYTFVSPVSAEDDHTDLAELPEAIANVVIAERNAR